MSRAARDSTAPGGDRGPAELRHERRTHGRSEQVVKRRGNSRLTVGRIAGMTLVLEPRVGPSNQGGALKQMAELVADKPPRDHCWRGSRPLGRAARSNVARPARVPHVSCSRVRIYQLCDEVAITNEGKLVALETRRCEFDPQRASRPSRVIELDDRELRPSTMAEPLQAMPCRHISRRPEFGPERSRASSNRIPNDAELSEALSRGGRGAGQLREPAAARLPTSLPDEACSFSHGSS